MVKIGDMPVTDLGRLSSFGKGKDLLGPQRQVLDRMTTNSDVVSDVLDDVKAGFEIGHFLER